MKLSMRSVFLGMAAALAAGAGAEAADLPVKAKPIEYVKICSAYGARFYYIPGTDICLRVGGRVRADYYHNAPGATPDIDSGNSRSEETHQLRGRGYLYLDARNNTAYGTLRAYLDMYFSTTTSSAGESKSGTHSRAFIQWAGFTFGLAQSFFDFYDSGAVANLDSLSKQTTGSSGWNVLAYTAQFGNGVSATLSVEDQRRLPVINNNAGAAPVVGAASVRAGQNLPALVGNVRVDQSWGSAQIMGAVQELRTNDAVAPTLETYGWAVGGGFTWNNPSAPGSEFGIQAAWAEGATGYVLSIYGAHNILDGAPAGGVASTGRLADGVVIGTTLHKTTAWGFNAGYQHRWTPQFASSIHGGYSSIEYDAAVNALCGVTCSFDFWSLGSRLLWTPVSGLEFGLDVIYHNFDTQLGAAALTASGVGALRDNDVWAAMFRVQRTF